MTIAASSPAAVARSSPGGLSDADYEILAVLSEHPAGRMPAQEMSLLLQWEKSRLSHQVRRMQERELIVREPNPGDARSAVIRLLPAGRRAIEGAAPLHVDAVRRHLIELFTPEELDTLAALNERILRHLADEPSPEDRDPEDVSEERPDRAGALRGVTRPLGGRGGR